MNNLLMILALACAQDDPAEFRKNVATAIDKGVEWLKKQQQPSGDFGESKGPTYGPGKGYPNKPGITAFARAMSASAAGQSFHATDPEQDGQRWNGEANWLRIAANSGNSGSPVPRGGASSPSKPVSRSMTCTV